MLETRGPCLASLPRTVKPGLATNGSSPAEREVLLSTARPSPFPSNGLDLMIEAVIIIGAVVVLAVTKSKKGKSFS